MFRVDIFEFLTYYYLSFESILLKLQYRISNILFHGYVSDETELK